LTPSDSDDLSRGRKKERAQSARPLKNLEIGEAELSATKYSQMSMTEGKERVWSQRRSLSIGERANVGKARCFGWSLTYSPPEKQGSSASSIDKENTSWNKVKGRRRKKISSRLRSDQTQCDATLLVEKVERELTDCHHNIYYISDDGDDLVRKWK